MQQTKLSKTEKKMISLIFIVFHTKIKVTKKLPKIARKVTNKVTQFDPDRWLTSYWQQNLRQQNYLKTLNLIT